MNKTLSTLVILAASAGVSLAAEQKTLLVVTANNGFRHSSIETTEKVIRELAAKSGDFKVISTMDHPDYPDYSVSAGGNRDADATWGSPFGPQVNDGTPSQITFIRKLNDRINSPLAPLQLAILDARKAVASASISDGRDSAILNVKIDALAKAELAMALAKAEQFQKLQASDSRLTEQQVQVLLGRATSGTAPRTSFAPQVGAATPRQQKAIAAANAAGTFVPLMEAVTTAQTELTAASLAQPRNPSLVTAKATALATAQQALASARATEFQRIQTAAGRFDPKVTKTLVSRFSLPETGSAQNDGAAKVFADMLSVEALKNYNGVFFASTVGTLPFPDLDGFIKWVNDGGAWLGNHAASDSMHGITKFFDMMGGEFTGHNQQTTEAMTVMDLTNPVGAAIGGKTLTVRDEMYTFENTNFDFSKVHPILSFTKAMNDGGHTPVGAPGQWPSVWIKNTGKGRVFYSALGHREDVIDPVITVTGEARLNSPDVAMAYQRMLLAGIKWSLKITDGDATPPYKESHFVQWPGVTSSNARFTTPAPAGAAGAGDTAPAVGGRGGQ